MKLLLLCGDHPRHRHVARQLMDRCDISGVVIQIREPVVVSAPRGLSEIDNLNFERHFEERRATEERFFGEPELPDTPVLRVAADRLNNPEVARFVAEREADAALVFGTGLLKQPLLEALPRATLNLHLGLSPRYRGAATLFWPFYFLEPEWAGATFHYLVAEPDAGQIVHQVRPLLYRTDGIHDVGCRTVETAAEAAVRLIQRLDSVGTWMAHSQRGTGKNFLAGDFRAQHLRVIYQLFDNDIVRAYLDGELSSQTPKLIVQPGC